MPILRSSHGSEDITVPPGILRDPISGKSELRSASNRIRWGTITVIEEKSEELNHPDSSSSGLITSSVDIARSLPSTSTEEDDSEWDAFASSQVSAPLSSDGQTSGSKRLPFGLFLEEKLRDSPSLLSLPLLFRSALYSVWKGDFETARQSAQSASVSDLVVFIFVVVVLSYCFSDFFC